MAKYTGGCACGAVRYEIAAEPMMQIHCQCGKCQHLSGAGHGDHLGFPKDALKLTGKLASWSYKADSGNTATSKFCPTCGSPVLGETTGFPVLAAIHVGSLDDPSVFKPQMVVFAEKGHAWDLLASGIPRFPKMPPM